MLALFAARPYEPPTFDRDASNLDAHLTNTCLQASSPTSPSSRTSDPEPDPDPLKTEPAHRFWSLPASDLAPEQKEAIFTRICAVTGELFEAAARAMTVHFQPLEQAFEVFGLDFLVDAAATPWLLEVNAFPDFKQTGARLTGVVGGFWRGVVGRAVLGRLVAGGGAGEGEGEDGMVLVRRVDLGRRWG
ncbi:hypothetical protein VTK26DRAFT_80 [Humicola hyalothermophila]